ncbi:MAG: hypothetical protein NT069_26170 [Planctomycetota bacterium]|nr:hypothetical protein [Planctomycetota bacterium]
MKFDQATIPLVPRTLSNCLDLAMLILRRGMRGYLWRWLLVALPTCALVYWLAYRFECNVFFAGVIAFVASGPLGLLTAAATAPPAFGDPLSVSRAFRRLGPGTIFVLLRSLAVRILSLVGLVVCIAPGVYLILRDSFFAEQRLLSKLSSQLHDRRTDKLLRGEWNDLLGRAMPLVIHGVLLWGVLLFTLDFASSWLLGQPILFGRLGVDNKYVADFGETFIAILKFLWSDPVVETAAVAVALFVYIDIRIAWFLCYIDVRVRRDCWDIELQISQETERLAASSS